MFSFRQTFRMVAQRDTRHAAHHVALRRIPVGQDRFGNRYYQSKDGKRRWVIYAGTVEGSRVPPEWHGWLHHTFAKPPTEDPPKVPSWQKEYVPNLSGTPGGLSPGGQLVG